jgi:hypothetical protein
MAELDEVVVNNDTKTDGDVAEVKLSKAEYEELVNYKATVGSLKREIKDLKKPTETKTETPEVKADEFGLLQKTFLISAGIKESDEVEYAKSFQKKYNMDWDVMIQDDVFNSGLTKMRNTKENANATNVRGGSGGGVTKSADFFIAKGVPPTAKDIPDRKARVAIINQMMDAEKNGGGKFYNE